MPERLSPGFAVFNYHVNDAKDHAREIFIETFGQEKWDEVLHPLETGGIMAIFDQEPTLWTAFYITTVTLIVNGDLIVPGANPEPPPVMVPMLEEVLSVTSDHDTDQAGGFQVLPHPEDDEAVTICWVSPGQRPVPFIESMPAWRTDILALALNRYVTDPATIDGLRAALGTLDVLAWTMSQHGASAELMGRAIALNQQIMAEFGPKTGGEPA